MWGSGDASRSVGINNLHPAFPFSSHSFRTPLTAHEPYTDAADCVAAVAFTMIDPFPIAPPAFLVSATKPFADAFNLHSLPLHVHEILFATALYTFTEKVFSPWISNLLTPDIYKKLSRRGKLNWDVHVVSFVQSLLINALSLYIIWFDKERATWRDDSQWEMRIWGYYGSGGLAQSFALGYFLWDLYTCSMHVEIFGWGMLAHAISAVAVFAFGYVCRPTTATGFETC